MIHISERQPWILNGEQISEDRSRNGEASLLQLLRSLMKLICLAW